MQNGSVSNGYHRPQMEKVQPGDEIVISGVAGRFPESNNVYEFRDNLMNKVDMVTDDGRRWEIDDPDIPQRTGKVNNIEKFDALFFGVHAKQVNCMDPMCRAILEHAFEAVLDAGVNPRTLRRSRTGVFVGTCHSESEKDWFYNKNEVNGFGLTGCSRSMLANRISYSLDVTGPSYVTDTACSSSLYAFDNAYRAIREGLCDAAIVGGANLCMHPYVSLQFYKLGVLSSDGRCKAFDDSANGYVRSETIATVFLQKAKDAKRIYSYVTHAMTNCDGFKEEGVTFPSSQMQSILLKEFYEKCGIPPTIIDYVEAHGTGTKVGDPEEVNALDKVFCTGRKTPLRIGSGKSNHGHAEPASGMCSVTKVIIAMETGIIPPNLNFTRPKRGVKALEEGRIKVITEPTPWNGGYVGINSFGFGGANAHVLLKSHDKEKINNGAPQDDLPRLVAVSGRTEEAVSTILDDLNSRPVDAEYVGLYHNIHSEDIHGHIYRGYTILPARGKNPTPIQKIEATSGTKRPVWFVFSGMGSQWPGMGEALLRIPVFSDAIRKCDAVLKPKGINIVDILTNKDKTAFDNILNSFVGIAAVQIGLVDVLKSLGIEPDNIIGHSVGELGCAYADGCFTAEQMILSAYSRGMASLETKVIRGSMAAVGMGYQELRNLCPPDIQVACHNSSESATISGPAESMKTFVAELTAKKIFAREVPCSNIPYHSQYIAPAGPKLLAYLQKVIPNPQPRSEKWLSTSVPMDKWNTPAAKYSSAEYHTNNLLSPVLFEETSAMIPKDAITIEIAPHGLLQAIIRRSLDPSVSNIALTQRGHDDNVQFLLQAIGNLFNLGMQPQLANLYPKIKFPVSRSTPMISPLIKWEHSVDWNVVSFNDKLDSCERVVNVALTNDGLEYVSGHVIDGRNLFPATGYLYLTWETFGMIRGGHFTELSVVFEDVKFLRATTVTKIGEVKLNIVIQKGTGRFEILEGDTAVVTGHIRETSNPNTEKINPPIRPTNEEESLSSRDVYKELRLRGYHYTGLFRSVRSSTVNGSKGHIAWQNNWVAFMDNMLQMQILSVDSRGLFVPTAIKKLVIDTKTHMSAVRESNETKELPVYVNKMFNTIVSGGIEIRDLKANAISRRKPAGEPVIEEYKFVPYEDNTKVSLSDLSRLVTHVCLENHLDIKVKTIELIEDNNNSILGESNLSCLMAESFGDLPLIQADISIISKNTELVADSLPANISIVDLKKINTETNALLAIGCKLLTKERLTDLNMLITGVREGGFLLTRELTDTIKNIDDYASSKNLEVVMKKKVDEESYILLRKRVKIPEKISLIYVTNNQFNWIDDMRKKMNEELEKSKKELTRIIFVGQDTFENGLMGFVNCLRRELGGDLVRGILIQDSKAPKFSLDNPLYLKQVKKDLAINVLRENGVWGSYRHLPLQKLKEKSVRQAFVNQLSRGDLSSLTWIEGPIGSDYTNDKNLVNIHYSALNFRDVMLATGKLAVETIISSRQGQECVIGMEYSGLDTLGKRLMGLVEFRGLSNLCVADPELAWEIPEKWSLEEAVTIPCVYGTCYYALYQKGNMKKGDKVLIHAGTGGIGQAAINLALHEGCEIFTTVGTPEKFRFIREHFPQIPEDHIGNSRDTSFERMIVELTKGKGVDIVLNSLAEEKLRASVNCLGWGGRFLEIGKFDLASNNQLGMEPFLKEISFQGVMLDHLFTHSTPDKAVLKKLMYNGIKNGAIKPLVRTVFPKDQIEAAFRYMAGGKHIGKVVIKVHDESKLSSGLALPRFYCLQDRSYIILGGLGGFGLELADWLVLRGAKNLVLTSRSGIKTGYQKMRIQLWQSYGVKIAIVIKKDAAKREDCEHILKTASNLAPVDGIFNLAVVLKDALWDNQTQESFEESFRPKAQATKQLDVLSRTMCPKLRQFVIFSSVSCGRGNAGQTNYGMSNSVMERICERRASEGLPALAIQWGAIGDVGLVADMQEDNKELVIGGTLQQSITSCLQELDGFLLQNKPAVSSMVVAEKRIKLGESSLNIVDTILAIMGVKDLKGVSPTASLAEMGMDSMMAVEIKQTLEREFEIFLTAQDIRGLNFAKLQEMNTTYEKGESSEMKDTKEREGVKLLVRLIGLDDINNETCLKLKTKGDSSLDELFFIPGLEGLSSVFSVLAPKIKAPASCLQPGIESSLQKTFLDIADLFLPHVVNKKNKSGQFRIVGYSTGAVVAVELARKLEAKGLKCKLILIDGAPSYLKKAAELMLPDKSKEDEFEDKFLLNAMTSISDKHVEELALKLKKCKSTWEDKLEALVSLWPTAKFNLSKENQRKLLTSVYKRLIGLLTHDISKVSRITAPITLIKPTAPIYQPTDDNYNLSEVTSGPIKVCIVEGNHSTVLDNDQVADLINEDKFNNNE